MSTHNMCFYEEISKIIPCIIKYHQIFTLPLFLCNRIFTNMCKEARWPSGRASDSGARGRGFDPHSGRRVVSLRKRHLPPKSTGYTQEAVAPSRHD